MATRDFLTATEVDPNGRIERTTARSTFTNLTNEEDAYLYWDDGVNHYNGDFEHLIDVCMTAYSLDWGFPAIWGLANLIDDYQGIVTANGDELSVHLQRRTDANAITLEERIAGTAYYALYNISLNTIYYLKIKRDETVGTFGTLYCYIYSDAARTNLLSTLSLALHEKEDFRYMYVTQSYNEGTSSSLSGYCENLDLQEPPPVGRSHAYIIG